MNKKLIKIGFLIFLLTLGAFAKVLESITIEGLIVQKKEFILKNIPLRIGNKFNSVDIQKAIKKLYSFGFFKDISFHVTNETKTSASVLIKVIENPICESIEFTGLKK